MYRRHDFRPARGRPALIIDCDDTLWPFTRTLINVLHPELRGEDTRGWDWPRRIAGDHGAERMFQRVFDHQRRTLHPPLPGAREGMHALADLGYRLVIISDRPPSTHRALVEWVRHHHLPADSVWVGRGCKVASGRRIGAVGIIDDRPDTLERAHRAGMLTATLAYTHNRDVRRRVPVLSARAWPDLTPKVVAHLHTSSGAM